MYHPSMTSMLRSPLLCATTFALCLAAAPAKADGPARERGEGSRFALGLGVISEASPYRGVGTDTKVLPVLMYENQLCAPGWPWSGSQTAVRWPSVFRADRQVLGRGLQSQRCRPNCRAWPSAKTASGWAPKRSGTPPGSPLSAACLGDASNHSGGQQFELEASKGFGLGKRMRLEPRLGLTWLDKSYVDHLLRRERWRSDTASRAAYTGPSTVNTELGLRLNDATSPLGTV